MKINETQRLKIKVAREDIVFVDMLFKAYEGLAMVTIDKKETGIIYLDYTSGTKSDVLDILEDLKEKINLIIYKK